MTKTSVLKAGDIKKEWLLFDAEGLVLGRLAATIAARLRGKHKPEFTPHLDCGDHIIVINAGKVVLTGTKEKNKTYYRHTGYPGGIRSTTAAKLRDKKPEELLLKAVRNMLPHGALAHQQFKHLYVYAGAEHKHQAQTPALVDFATANRHNAVA